MKAIHIMWDVDYEDGDVMFPKEIELPAGMTDEEENGDYITNQTGWCHQWFEIEI